MFPNTRTQRERQDLLDRAAAAIARHPEIAFCHAHGSFVQPGPYRDLDLAVYLSEPLPRSRFPYEDALEQEITGALKAELPVDVRIANEAPLAFQHHAYQGRLLLDRDPELRATVVAHVAARHLDIKPILDHHAREAFGRDPLDGDRLRAKLGDITSALTRLQALVDEGRDAFLNLPDNQDIARSRLLTAIEAALNICFHLCAKRLEQIPDDYAACFDLLGRAGLVPADLAGRLARMARFRNRLVHLYWDVDYGEVFDFLPAGLEDLRRYVETIGRML